MSQQQIETAADVVTEMLASNSPAEVQAQVRRAYLLGRFEEAASNMDQLLPLLSYSAGASVRNAKLKELHGEFAWQNFPDAEKGE